MRGFAQPSRYNQAERPSGLLWNYESIFISHGLIEKYWKSQIMSLNNPSRCLFFPLPRTSDTIFRCVFVLYFYILLYIQILMSSVPGIPKHMLLRNIRQTWIFFLNLRMIIIGMRRKLCHFLWFSHQLCIYEILFPSFQYIHWFT